VITSVGIRLSLASVVTVPEAPTSTAVTLAPSTANIDAYWMPITPASTITIDVGVQTRYQVPGNE
jgi:hypothetical protein